MKVEINGKKIGKILIVIASFFLVFPFLVICGYYLRVFIEKRKDSNIPRPLITTDKETLSKETGVVVI